jgi:hypothetical protein
VTLRSRHGNARNFGAAPILETLPVDELPEGVPAERPAELPGDRGPNGQFAAGNSLAAQAGAANRGKARLASRLGLRQLPETAVFKSYKNAAVSLRRTTCAELAKTVGGGACGPIPSSFVASAALALGWSRYFFDHAAESGETELVLAATKLAEASSSLLRQAHEYAAKEAKARPQMNSIDALKLRMAAGRTGQSAFDLPDEDDEVRHRRRRVRVGRQGGSESVSVDDRGDPSRP